MSAVESEVGVGQCPKRPEGMGHVWAGIRPENGGDGTNPCRFCGYSGRVFFKEWCAARMEMFSALRAPMQSGTGDPRKAWPDGMPPEMQARLAKVREDIARDDAERPWSGEGADRRRVAKGSE